VLYWYQAASRSVASDHVYRAWLVYNRLVHHRSDGALVRLIMPVGERGDMAPQEALLQFAYVFQPALARTLPR
jgi:hypothetical protein